MSFRMELFWRTIEYKHILAALIDSEQMLLSIEAQLCTRKEFNDFCIRKSRLFTGAQLQCSTTFVLNVLEKFHYLAFITNTHTHTHIAYFIAYTKIIKLAQDMHS